MAARKKAAPKKGKRTLLGRPSMYTQEIEDEICQRIASGESLSHITLDDHMPSAWTVRHWVLGRSAEVPDSFSRNYEAARQLQAELYFEQVISIADGAHEAGDVLGEKARHDNPRDPGAYKRTYEGEVSARKLRLDSRKWVLARMNRVKFGDKSDIGLGGTEGAPPIEHQEATNLDHLSPEETKHLRELARKAITGKKQ